MAGIPAQGGIEPPSPARAIRQVDEPALTAGGLAFLFDLKVSFFSGGFFLHFQEGVNVLLRLSERILLISALSLPAISRI